MPEPFKNFISPQVVRTLGKLVLAAYPQFNYDRYTRKSLRGLETLELKSRAKHIATHLWEELPDDPTEAIDTLRRAILPVPVLRDDDSFDGWLFMVLNSLLHAHGLESWEASMKLLPEITRRFTAEFGIRAFLNQNPRKMQPLLKHWAKSKDQHLRRLVSEGTRPRLPWGEQIPAFIADPSPVLPLLELLKDDPAEYVRRSVANNLNDIAKDNPEQMLDLVQRWLPDASKERLRLIKHACRSLVKQGHPRCLKLLGYGTPAVDISEFSISPDAIELGEPLSLQLSLASTSDSPQELIVDYRFNFVKANGKTAPKVFKGSAFTLNARKEKNLCKRFHLKPISTRRYYTGDTPIELLINGTALAKITFHLSAP